MSKGKFALDPSLLVAAVSDEDAEEEEGDTKSCSSCKAQHGDADPSADDDEKLAFISDDMCYICNAVRFVLHGRMRKKELPLAPPHSALGPRNTRRHH